MLMLTFDTFNQVMIARFLSHLSIFSDRILSERTCLNIRVEYTERIVHEPEGYTGTRRGTK